MAEMTREKSSDAKESDDKSTLVHSEPDLNEDSVLALLRTGDASMEEIKKISKNALLMKSRKVRFALAVHRRTPRRISLKLIREFYTLDLMRFALAPPAPADLKHIAEELLISRISSITLGERISLARRSSTRVTAALLVDREAQVWEAALENPRLTEAAVIKALGSNKAGPAMVNAICRHSKWSRRRDLRVSLLQNEHIGLERALEFARELSPEQLRDVLDTSRLPEEIKNCLRVSVIETTV